MDDFKPSVPSPSPPLSPMRVADSHLDLPLATALTRQELLRRRSRRARQLARCYKAHYWALMEELKAKHKEYYWLYGKSPYKEEEEEDEEEEEGDCKKARKEGSGGNDEEEATETLQIRRCEVTGCKAKAMALTKYCHTHILSDSKQKLYQGCTYCIKSTQTGPILCCKPVLRSTVPLLCSSHMQVAEKHLIRALKRGGLNVSSTKKLAPKFHVIVAESVRQIQTKRRAALKASAAQIQTEEDIR